jgi:hypothetical protein
LGGDAPRIKRRATLEKPTIYSLRSMLTNVMRFIDKKATVGGQKQAAKQANKDVLWWR